MKLYSVKDKVMGFSQIFVAPNDLGAMRVMSDNVNNDNTIYNIHAEDFDLYCLGELDETTGTITPETRFMQKLVDFKK